MGLAKWQNIPGLEYTEITADDYPGMSEEANATRHRILSFNSHNSGLPWKIHSIKKDVKPDADELIIEFTLANIVKDVEWPFKLDFSKSTDLGNGKVFRN